MSLKINLLNKKGFYKVIEVLANFKGFKAEIHTFYRELNKNSYYNSFYRLKDDLIAKGLININSSKGKKYIRLSKKVTAVYNKLVEINNILNE